MNKEKKEEIIKKIQEQGLIDKKDAVSLKKPFVSVIKKDIEKKKEEITKDYINSILLKNKISF